MSVKVWSWRNAVQKAQLKPTTKHVLLNLSVYMNDVGDSCYPSINQQSNDTGLSPRAVCEHLNYAVEAGFLKKDKHGFAGQNWMRNEYTASIPQGFVFGKGMHAGYTPSAKKACTVATEGMYPSDKKACTQGTSNSSLNSPKNSPRGGFSEKDGDKSGGYKIGNRLTATGLDGAKRCAPGWDIYYLMRIYDASVNTGHLQAPNCPDAAFAGWCKKYTKGKRP